MATWIIGVVAFVTGWLLIRWATRCALEWKAGVQAKPAHYRLRTLLIVLAMGPPALAWAWFRYLR